MNVLILQHVDFEGPGQIQRWVSNSGYTFQSLLITEQTQWPRQEAFDMLIIMGGPMGVYDEAQYPWLHKEKQFIHDAIALQKPVVGICLGAQLIACVLGASVYPAQTPEIGWFPVYRVPQPDTLLASLLPETFTPLHWHGDTFDLPHGAIRLAETSVCPNQAFCVGERILGLQFHLEANKESVSALVASVGTTITPGPWQQTSQSILKTLPSPVLHATLYKVLTHLSRLT